jgi:hypothetical protein
MLSRGGLRLSSPSRDSWKLEPPPIARQGRMSLCESREWGQVCLFLPIFLLILMTSSGYCFGGSWALKWFISLLITVFMLSLFLTIHLSSQRSQAGEPQLDK